MEIIMERIGVAENLSAKDAMKYCMDKYNESYFNHEESGCLVYAYIKDSNEEAKSSFMLCPCVPGNYAEELISKFDKFVPVQLTMFPSILQESNGLKEIANPLTRMNAPLDGMQELFEKQTERKES